MVSGLPPELSSRILTFCDAKDLASFSQASTQTRNLVYAAEDQYIWRSVFLNTFDDPRRAIQPKLDFDWKKELQRRTIAQSIALSSTTPEDVDEALEALIGAVHEALPATGDEESKNITWLQNLLLESKFLDTLDPPLGHLHALVNLSHEEIGEYHEERELILRERRTNSRSFVYDLRNYHSKNGWAPFTGDSEVNWVHINHLIHVLLMNLREVPTLWGRRPPLGLEATRAYSAPRSNKAEDWAGVEGIWRRYVCFMDYRDLFAFNYSNVAGGPRSPKFFEDKRFREATRLIEVKLHLVPRDQLKLRRWDDHELGPESGSSKSRKSSRPPLYFSGTSRGYSGNEAMIEGSVHVGKDGYVRWYFATMYDGVTQWCSQGVQLGNVGSAAGVVGNWTTSLHDQGDPVGPFWLWKVEEDSAPTLVDFT